MLPAALQDLDLTAPLQDAELARLDALLGQLAERLEALRGEEADSVRDTAELDGFVLAVVAGPVPLAQEQWLPAVWGGELPAFQTEQEAEEVLALVLRHHNATARLLDRLPDAYDPVFAYEVDADDGQEYESVAEWCAGFLRGMELAWEQWQPLMERAPELFALLQLFGTEEGWAEQEEHSEETWAELQDSLPEAARALAALGLEARAAAPRPAPHDVPGRS